MPKFQSRTIVISENSFIEASKGKKGDAISKISMATLSRDLFPEDFKRV